MKIETQKKMIELKQGKDKRTMFIEAISLTQLTEKAAEGSGKCSIVS